MRQAVGGALCVLIFSTGCSGSDDSAAPETTAAASTVTSTEAPTTTTVAPASSTTSTTTTTVPEPPDEEQILAVVVQFVDVVIEANNPPDPNSSLWAGVVTPALGDDLRSASQRTLDAGEGIRDSADLPVEILAPSVVFDEAGVALVELCLRDSAVTYSLDDQSVVDDAVLYIWVQHVVESSEGSWLVATANNVETFAEEDACVASLSG